MGRNIFFLLAVVCMSLGNSFSEQKAPPIPSLEQWEENMVFSGENFLQPLKRGMDENLVWYYDGIKVYYQIAAYTKDDKWLKGVKVCRDWYRDLVLSPEMIGGWRLFPHGLYLDYKKTGDPKSKEAILKLARSGAFANRTIDYAKTSIYDLKTVPLSREVAYNINCYQVARELGEPDFQKPDPYLDLALGHLSIWSAWLRTDRKSYAYDADNGTGFQPFMVGLTCEALIRYYESKGADPVIKEKIFKAVKEIALLMWEEAWVEKGNALYYESNRKQAAPDLNLLIAPVYAWLWHRTGDLQFVTKGDKLFEGGVKKAWIGGGKQFSQSYRWSFDYVNWRTVAPVPFK